MNAWRRRSFGLFSFGIPPWVRGSLLSSSIRRRLKDCSIAVPPNPPPLRRLLLQSEMGRILGQSLVIAAEDKTSSSFFPRVQFDGMPSAGEEEESPHGDDHHHHSDFFPFSPPDFQDLAWAQKEECIIHLGSPLRREYFFFFCSSEVRIHRWFLVGCVRGRKVGNFFCTPDSHSPHRTEIRGLTFLSSSTLRVGRLVAYDNGSLVSSLIPTAHILFLLSS